MPSRGNAFEWARSIATWSVLLAVLGLAAFFPLRVLFRRIRLKRFAKRHGFVRTEDRASLPAWWSDLACFKVDAPSRAMNCVQGERRGRRFVAFDFHYDLGTYGGAARANMGVLLVGWFYWILLPVIDRTRDPGFSAAVVECSIPPGARTAHLKQRLRPWRVEFGAEASVIRREDGFCSMNEMLAALDLLNSALDEVLAAPPAAAA
jgi:hypothetical protein